MPQADPLANPPSILLIEPDAQAANLIRQVLDTHYARPVTIHCPGREALEAHDLSAIDLIFCGLDLDDQATHDVIKALIAYRADRPIIMLVRPDQSGQALAALHRGVHDYVVRDARFPACLPAIAAKNLILREARRQQALHQHKLEGILDQLRGENQQLEETILELQTMAGTDPLTGLANRRAFARAMDRCFAEARRYNRQLACIMIDLDGFKQLNDAFGHPIGDRMLDRAARVLEANCRRSDVAARIGGDEFILLLPRTNQDTACDVAHRIRQEFAKTAGLELAQSQPIGAGGDPRITMSMGLACLCDTTAITPDQLVACADTALYQAKQQGKTRLGVYALHSPRLVMTNDDGLDSGTLNSNDESIAKIPMV